jgi:hypothetical protein
MSLRWRKVSDFEPNTGAHQRHALLQNAISGTLLPLMISWLLVGSCLWGNRQLAESPRGDNSNSNQKLMKALAWARC